MLRSLRAYSTEHRHLLLAALAILAATFIVTYPVLRLDEWYRGLQAYRYPYLGNIFYDMVAAGIFYPRWLPDLMGGYGYPTFVYYQPGVFYYFLPFRLFTPDILLAVKAGLFCMFLIGGTGIFLLARLYCRPLFALVIVALYVGMQQFAAVMNTFGNYSELFGGLLCPWVLYFTLLLARRIEEQARAWGALAGLTLSSAALLYTHPFVSYFFMPAVCIVAAGLFWQMEHAYRKRFAIGVAVCFVMALALSSPYWFTIWQLKDEVTHERELQEFRSIGFGELYSGLFDTGPPLSHAFSANPYYWVYYFLLAYAGFALGLLKNRRLFAVATLCALFWGFLTTKYAIWLWSNVPLMKYTQFPRRLVTGLVTLYMFGTAQLVAALDALHANARSVRHRRWLACAAVLIAVVPVTNMARIEDGGVKYSYPYTPRRHIDYDKFAERAADTFSDMTHSREFTPVYFKKWLVEHRLNDHIPLVQSHKGTAKIKMTGARAPYVIEFAAKQRRRNVPMEITINQLYIKGWKIVVDDKEARFMEPGETAPEAPAYTYDQYGKIRLLLPKRPAAYRIKAWYDGPPGWQIRNAIIALIAFTGGAMLWSVFGTRKRLRP